MILQQLSPEEALEHRGIRPTAVRLMIFKEMRALDCAVSQADIEQRLETVDKSTVSRRFRFLSVTIWLILSPVPAD